VPAARPVLLNVVPVGVAICAKFVHVAPWQRSSRYPVTPMLSVDAFHARLTPPDPLAVAVSPEGTVGSDVSTAPAVDPRFLAG